MNPPEKYLIQFLYMLLHCLLYIPVAITIQIFSPIFYCTILPLIINWWCIYFICDNNKVIIISVIVNLWNGKITLRFNSFESIIFMCSCGFNSNLFQWIIMKKLTWNVSLHNQWNYQGTFLIIENEYYLWQKNHYGQYDAMKI